MYAFEVRWRRASLVAGSLTWSSPPTWESARALTPLGRLRRSPLDKPWLAREYGETSPPCAPPSVGTTLHDSAGLTAASFAAALASAALAAAAFATAAFAATATLAAAHATAAFAAAAFAAPALTAPALAAALAAATIAASSPHTPSRPTSLATPTLATAAAPARCRVPARAEPGAHLRGQRRGL